MLQFHCHAPLKLVPDRKRVDVKRTDWAVNWPTPDSAIFRRQNDISLRPVDQIGDDHPVSGPQLRCGCGRWNHYSVEVAGKAGVLADAEVGLERGVKARLELCPASDRVERLQHGSACDRARADDGIFVSSASKPRDGSAAIALAFDLEPVPERDAPVGRPGPRVDILYAGISLISGICLTAVISAESDLKAPLAG